MARRKDDKPQRVRGKQNKELEALYAKMRRAFTAADLQKYTEIEEGVPLEQVIAEMEQLYREFKSKKP